MYQCVALTHSPSEVARSLPPECVEKGLNGAGECVVSEIEIDLVMSYVETSGAFHSCDLGDCK